MSSSTDQFSTYLDRAFHLQSPSEAEKLYDEWAPTYDSHLDDYASPQRSVEAVIKNLDDSKSNFKILDAGCGTGLVGDALVKSELKGKFLLDGSDLTPGMLEVARKKGMYRDLEASDLTKPIEHTDGSYDVVLCVGTLTKGHVGPNVFNEFARVTAKGGLVVATVHDDIWESGGYKSVVEGMGKAGEVEVIGTEEFGILKEDSKGGRMVVLRRK